LAKAMGNHIGRKGVEILIDKVKEMLDKGMSIYEAWKTLKDEGQLRYKDRQGKEHIITYQHFHRRIKQLLAGSNENPERSDYFNRQGSSPSRRL
jgi:hypothetical protein